MLTKADPRPTLAAPDDDPWLWLEEIEGTRALDYVAAQTAKTLDAFADPRFEADRDALTEALDRPDRIPFITRRGGLLYNFWRDADHPRGLFRRTTPERYRSGEPDWDVLLDLDALAAEEGQDWVWGGSHSRAPDHDRAILRLSRGGSDAVTLREFDLETKRFVADGFNLSEGKSQVSWLDRDTVLLRSPLGEGMATSSGYARTVRLWRRGADPLSAPILFEGAASSMSVYAQVHHRHGVEWCIFGEQLGFYDVVVHIGDRTGPKQKIDRPTDVSIEWNDDFVVLTPRTDWQVAGRTYPSGCLLGLGLDAFLAGGRDFRLLFQPTPRRAIQGFFWSNGRLILSLRDDLHARFIAFDPRDDWSTTEIHGLPELGVAEIWRLDDSDLEDKGDLIAYSADPVTPPALYEIQPDLGTPQILRQAPTLFGSDGLVVTRHEAVSVDGERIPYIQAGPPGETGEAPVHLSGYGGFMVSNMPGYSVTHGRLWLEKGGTTVVANIRGGGEFGPWWHEAGRREKKARSHDDFAAVAADLVRRGVSRPERIAAEGGSNGGLLIANMLVRYPERFGALLCTVPLIDMRRYHRLLAGASWIAEYGDPDRPEDWAFLQHISAYHTAEPGKAYPPILIATTRRDDRVHPGHARKMAAKLQAMGYLAYLFEQEGGGHGAGRNNREAATFATLGLAFLSRAIGWEAAESLV
ncbi:peptidase S9 [Xaviernesmea oryzae]|uniref:Peptidase S9 n=1 Tax=Xaviernesmea oryzae TaxID=464029 RepID=A0A1Q9B398_9HYPH|nr:prolyl oligopeptidase family serine peptidase [Xaviernesmea oryzae]OLP62534.1 peptidase S9 [Xaviernesmea oryzae]SEM20357.1 prolyl oligopeptidase [Xaviernesmea oryzae]